MSKLNEANDRLDAAMMSVEKAVEIRRKNTNHIGAANDQSNQLQGELDKLRIDLAALRDTSSTVSDCLDVAIRRLRNVLDD
jgi:flagellar motility protein MotE (MotC chaperone)